MQVAFLENMNFMSKQGPLDIQTAVFEGYLEVWVCSTRKIFLKIKIKAKLGQLSHFSKTF